MMLVEQEVKKALDEVRPHLQADGGDVEFVDIKDGVVRVRLKGSCAGCPMSQMTIKWGVENFIKKKIPDIKSVEAI
jgi:Fe-S cluster biogenesis protein NfuA